MSLALIAALLVAPATLPTCSWDRPGVNPFMGDVVAAVDDYTDIPPEVRTKLKVRIASRAFDEIATIQRDTIMGKAIYEPSIRDMHFGAGQVCQTVTRKKWTDKMQERGLVYCESDHCLIVPTVCRNVSRITRKGAAVASYEQTMKEAATQAVAAAPDDSARGGGSTEAQTGELPQGSRPDGGMFGSPSSGGSGGFVAAVVEALRGIADFIVALPWALFSDAPISRIAALVRGDSEAEQSGPIVANGTIAIPDLPGAYAVASPPSMPLSASVVDPAKPGVLAKSDPANGGSGGDPQIGAAAPAEEPANAPASATAMTPVIAAAESGTGGEAGGTLTPGISKPLVFDVGIAGDRGGAGGGGITDSGLQGGPTALPADGPSEDADIDPKMLLDGPGSAGSAPSFVNGEAPLGVGTPEGSAGLQTVREPPSWALLLLCGLIGLFQATGWARSRISVGPV